MKRRTTPTLKVSIDIDIGKVGSIEFLFKQKRDESNDISLKISYPQDVDFENGVFLIPFTEAQTCIFKPGKIFYMDTRIMLKNGNVPQTEIIELFMCDTLFNEGDIND